MELSQLQQSIILDDAPKSVVHAAAASGKTRTLTEKARYLLQQGVDPRGMAVITFTNMAAAELKLRLGDDYKDEMFVGTIHSLANRMLTRNGIKTGGLIADEKFDDFFALIEENPQCVQHFNWVLLDEAQDSGAAEFKFILGSIDPYHFQFYGDVRQSIYRFKGACPQILQSIMRRSDIKVFDMNENYRNGSNILAFAKKRILRTGLIDTSVSMRRGENGIVRQLSFDPSKILELIKTSSSYHDWAILTRTNAQIGTIGRILKKANVPYDTFKQSKLTYDNLIEKMTQNTVKLLTIHSAKGLEWNKVIVVFTQGFGDEIDNIAYVAATRARDELYWMT